MAFSPEDLAQTTPILFFTRWITHFCAPVFMFLAGAGAYLQLQRDGWSTPRLSRYLFTRGLWLVIVELTVMRLAMNFSFDTTYPFLLLILWALGASMIVLAALIHMPLPLIAAASALVLLFHNMDDGIRAAQFGAFAPLWNLLHQQGAFMVAGRPVVVAYPVLPWIAVMAAGYCFGPVKNRGSPADDDYLRSDQSPRSYLSGGYGDPAVFATGWRVAACVLRPQYPPSL